MLMANYLNRIVLEPSEARFKAEKPATLKAFIDQFLALPKGTKLYTLKAIRKPTDTKGLVLGDVVMTDQCVSSYFGDTRMFFRHQWLEDDIMLKPKSWTKAYEENCFCDVKRYHE